VIASDETSARGKGKTHWQWTFGCTTAVYHMITPTRGKCVPMDFLAGARPKVWLSDRLPAQCTHAEAHQFCLAHLIRDAQYAIDHGDTIFAPQFKAFLKDACAVGRRRPDLADSTIGVHRRRLDRELDRLLDLKPTDVEGSHLRIYGEWRRCLSPTMRQTDIAGDKLFVDWAGGRVSIIDPMTGEVHEAHLFVAALGASSYTYAKARWSETLHDWIGAHVNALDFLGGVPKAAVPDNLKAGITKPSRYEPGVNRRIRISPITTDSSCCRRAFGARVTRPRSRPQSALSRAS
jgi:hypothetical protein